MRQHRVEVVAGADQVVVDAQPRAAAPHLDQVFFQRFQVAVAQGARIAQQLRQLLHALEARGAGEREGQLVVVQDVEDEDVVPALAQHFQAAEQRLAVDQQVGDEDDHAAAVRRVSVTRRRIFSMSVFSRGRLTCIALTMASMCVCWLRGRHDLAHVRVEGDAADRVLLAQAAGSQAGGDGAGVVVLVQRAAAVVHRLADVDDEVAAQVGLCLVLLDVKAVGLGPDLPVEVADVVAGGVLAVLHELDASGRRTGCGACRR